MSHENDPGFAMVVRAIDRLEESMERKFDQVREDIQSYTPREVFLAHKEETDRRIGTLERAKETYRYGLYAAVVTGAVAFVSNLIDLGGK